MEPPNRHHSQGKARLHAIIHLNFGIELHATYEQFFVYYDHYPHEQHYVFPDDFATPNFIRTAACQPFEDNIKKIPYRTGIPEVIEDNPDEFHATVYGYFTLLLSR